MELVSCGNRKRQDNKCSRNQMRKIYRHRWISSSRLNRNRTIYYPAFCAQRQRSCPDFAVLTSDGEGEDADAGDDGKEKDDEDDGSRGAAS